ncbi:hypothetical protein EW145_g3092 [Phellinidium pouzarii]|uniref:DNA helicase n=1 Tax=Phellinidium pouzarii TaxID=167371 RepID=A0A4S4L8M3_9AGAM|nr:hypothetical protein EW145_g3092 [Phellinidium pouzarii]
MVRGRARSNASRTHSDRASTSAAAGVEDEIVVSERRALILERQGELERVLDRHDDLVREAFHLERFITLLQYDPLIAKQDQTPVFLEACSFILVRLCSLAYFLQYKANYDLVMKTPGSGPSRTTRRTQNERLSTLKSVSQPYLPSVSQSVSAPMKPSRSAAVRPSKMVPSKSSSVAPLKSSNISGMHSPTSVSAVGTIPQRRISRTTSRIAKGKQKESVSDEESEADSEMLAALEGHIAKGSSKSRGNQRAVNAPPASALRSTRIRHGVTEDTPLPSIIVRNGGPIRNYKRSCNESTSQPSKKIRFKKMETNSTTLSTVSSPTTRSMSPFVPAHPTVSGKTLPSKPTVTTVRPAIRRVRLIVREPPPTISSPSQRPRPAMYGRSLSALLASYVELEGKEQNESYLNQAALRSAKTMERIIALRREGRLLKNVKDYRDSSAPTHHPRDIWAAVVAEACTRRNAFVVPARAPPLPRFGRGGILAAAVSARMRVHWENVLGRKNRDALVEERRLRALAKSILRLVLDEWKKVVFHVREEQRRVQEDEEKRRGRQHLAAILDQSGQILEKQQMELVRTDVMRSRSGTSSVDDEVPTDNDNSDDLSDEEEKVSEIDYDVDRVDDEDEDREASDGESAIEQKCNSALLASTPEIISESLSGDKYIDFSVPLNDVDIESEYALSESGPQDQDAQSLGDTMDEDDVTDNKGFLPGEEKEDEDEDEDEESTEEVIFNETEHIMGEDGESLDDPSFATADSLGTSLESTPFIDDIHIHDNEVLHLGLNMDTSLEGFNSPVLNLARDFVHSSLDISNEGMERHLGSLKPASKPHPTTAISNMDVVDPSTIVKVVDVDGVQSKLLNGDSHLENAKYAEVGPNLVPADVRDIVHSKANGTSTDANVHILPEVDMQSLPEGGASPNPNTLNIHDQNKHSPDSQVYGSDTVVVVHKEDQDEKDGAYADNHVPEPEPEWEAPPELRPYSVARVEWTPETKLAPPLLLRGNLRLYQQSGLEWLAALHNNKMNGILADEMGLGKTIQTIALLAHLACDRGIWGPHLIIVPTSVLLNWEMEFKKFLPGFKILSYHGSTKRRKELRQGWNSQHAFNVCVTSYTLASRDQHIFKRKAWYYMILDEAHMIKNFKSQRWNILLMFRSFRRLLLTGTPLQNNLTELWALLQFLMSGSSFANLKDFGEWFSNPLEKAIEQGNVQDEEVQAQVTKLHTVLRPYLLRRLKRDVEKELPSKYEHLVLCRLSKRQRFLYDEFMSRNQTREDLKSGVYQRIANILMQLRKVCNHPDLFEVRPVVTSFAMDKSAIAEFEIKELLIRRRFFEDDDQLLHIDLDLFSLQFTRLCGTSSIASRRVQSLEEVIAAEVIATYPGEPPPRDTRTIEGYRIYNRYQQRLATYGRYKHMLYLNRLRCNRTPIYSLETVGIVKQLYNPLTSICGAELLLDKNALPKSMIKSYAVRAEDMADAIDKFAFATPAAIARDLPSIALRGVSDSMLENYGPDFDNVLHRASVKLQIAFPDVSLLQYDCGKLQELARLLRERKDGGHRVLIFTQMTRILDILEMFLNFHGYLYLRLDGGTKIEDRQYITERFNVDERVFAFIASSRSGGVGINLTGADTVIFYDSDFNPQMDRQCEDRAHRIGQIRDVHIYRFISQYTVEEAMLRKANQKRSLDDIVIQQGEFDWRTFFRPDEDGKAVTASALQVALTEFEDYEDAHAAKIAANEEAALQGEDREDFGDADAAAESGAHGNGAATPIEGPIDVEPADEEEEGGTTIDYMLKVVRSDPEYFREWKLP